MLSGILSRRPAARSLRNPHVRPECAELEFDGVKRFHANAFVIAEDPDDEPLVAILHPFGEPDAISKL